MTEQGTKVYQQPRDTWIDIPVAPIVDEETWDRAQKLKKQRLKRSKRNTRMFYLLQHLLRCAECGMMLGAKGTRFTTHRRNGKVYRYDFPDNPRRYYMCGGMQRHGLRCREKPYIRAERLEERVWSEVKRVLQNPDLIVAGIEAVDDRESDGLAEEVARAERELRSCPDGRGPGHQAVRVWERSPRTISTFSASSSPSGWRASGQSWTTTGPGRRAEPRSGRWWKPSLHGQGEVGDGLDELAPEQRREVLQLVVEQVMIDRDNNMDVTLAIPVDGSVPITSQSSRSGSGF